MAMNYRVQFLKIIQNQVGSLQRQVAFFFLEPIPIICCGVNGAVLLTIKITGI